MIINPVLIKGQLLQAQNKLVKPSPPLPGSEGKEKQPAAVLIPLLLDQEDWKILFIKRTQHQDDRHSGQVVLPGVQSADWRVFLLKFV